MNLDPEVLMLGLALAVLAHAALFASYRLAHPVMVLLMAFAVLSLLSTASLVPGVEQLKWARVYATLLAVAVAACFVRPSLLGVGSWAMLGFAVLYVFAALWSDAPIHGVLFKGLFLLTLMLGMAAVFVARELDRLWTLQRGMVLATGAVVGVVAVGAAIAPGALLDGGRLAVLGLNPNRIAETLAPLLLFCGFGLLYDPAKTWRLICYAIALPAAAMVLATGSRAGFGMVMVGFAVLLLPVMRRPGAALAVMAVIAVSGLAVLGVLEERRAIQLGAYDLTTRHEAWARSLEMFRDHVMFGVGWAYQPMAHGYGSTNLLSIYIQVMVEMGMLGLIVLLGALGRVAWSGITALRATASEPHLRPFAYLGGALLVGVAAHGVAESGALMGSTLSAACLGVSAATFDWLLATARARRAWWAAMHGTSPVSIPTPQPR